MKDDVISRQKSIDAVRVMQTYKLSEGDDMLLVDQAEVMTELMMLSPAKPVRMKGNWVRKLDGVYCSVCHQGWDFITGVPIEVEGYNFCPNCGASMSEGEEDED